MQHQATAQASTEPVVVVGPQGKGPVVRVFTDAGETQVLQIPKSHDEMMALMAQHEALNAQLEQLKDQRSDLIEELKSVPNAARPGLEKQLTDVSNQIADMQRQVNLMAREMASASPELIAMTRDHEDPNPDEPGSFADGVFAGAAGGVIGLALILLLGRWIWKKFVRDDVPSRALPAADSERLQRLENGMEAIAIEVERISEGQRYVTKLMSESRGLESTPR